MHTDPTLSPEDLALISQDVHLQSPQQLRANLERLLASLPDDVRAQFLQHEIDARAQPPQRPA